MLCAELQVDLDADLTLGSTPQLPASLGTAGGSRSLEGTLVLQVVSSVDVSAAGARAGARAAEPRAGRCLLLTLTDGTTRCTALEVCPVPQLTAESCRPGTKLALRSVAVRRGVLMLAPACVRVLGGQVPALLEREQARAEQEAMGADRLGKEGATQPPPFVDLGDGVTTQQSGKQAAPAAGRGTGFDTGSTTQQPVGDARRGAAPHRARRPQHRPEPTPEPEPEPEPELKPEPEPKEGEWGDGWLAEQRAMEKQLLQMQMAHESASSTGATAGSLGTRQHAHEPQNEGDAGTRRHAQHQPQHEGFGLGRGDGAGDSRPFGDRGRGRGNRGGRGRGRGTRGSQTVGEEGGRDRGPGRGRGRGKGRGEPKQAWPSGGEQPATDPRRAQRAHIAASGPAPAPGSVAPGTEISGRGRGRGRGRGKIPAWMEEDRASAAGNPSLQHRRQEPRQPSAQPSGAAAQSQLDEDAQLALQLQQQFDAEDAAAAEAAAERAARTAALGRGKGAGKSRGGRGSRQRDLEATLFSFGTAATAAECADMNEDEEDGRGRGRRRR